VTNLRNMKSVIVRVNDRGPHVRGRIVDLSRTAAELIGITHTGLARVELEILKP
jgi:rare lipoprotein A